LPELLSDAPFARFICLSDWLYAKTDATHRISPDRLAGLLNEWLSWMNQETSGDITQQKDDATTSSIAEPKVLATQRQQRHQAA
jgi:hypothetical protein